LHSELPEVKFILVGPLDEGSPDSIPKSYLIENNKHNNFMWIGFRREVKELYAIADLAVLPSYYREGGFPRALTEPMAMGKPVITTNSVHCRGTVEEGKNGYLVPVKDSKALADAIAILINDDNKRKEFGRYSRLKAENEFNEKVIVPKVVKEFFG
jgi:N,N'-diacetylbacillosaminyl-diphospho-undecaprenol alpha-1,3-N-acetylgalactosaminyltransferase